MPTPNLSEMWTALGAEHFWERYGKPDTELGRELAERVLASGLSTSELARRSGYGRTTVASVLLGRRGGSIWIWNTLLKVAQDEILATQGRNTKS